MKIQLSSTLQWNLEWKLGNMKTMELKWYSWNFNGSYISVHPDLSRPILVRPSSENHSGSKGLRSVRSDAP